MTYLVPLKTLEKKIKSSGLKEIEDYGYSKAKNKKYYVKVNGKKINFGDKRYPDNLYATHNKIDWKDRRSKYRQRHKNDDIDKFKAGRYSWYLLW